MHPTVTDGNIKVVGIGDFPWIVEDNLYEKLRNEYIHEKEINNSVAGILLLILLLINI
jgi:hypothetical protein